MPAEKLITNYSQLGQELDSGISAVACCRELSVHVGPGCDEVAADFQFQFMAQELIDNCAEKPAKNIDIGLSLTYDEAAGMYRLVVEDNVSYPPDELKQILANLKRKHSKHEGKNGKRVAEGGVAKSMIQHHLKSWGGSLTFEPSPEGHVIAVAEWTREGFYHPIKQQGTPSYLKSI